MFPRAKKRRLDLRWEGVLAPYYHPLPRYHLRHQVRCPHSGFRRPFGPGLYKVLRRAREPRVCGERHPLAELCL